MNRAFVQCCSPIKNFDAGRDRHQKAQDRENHPSVNRLARYKHVMAPDQKPENGNGHAGGADPGVAENPFTRKTGDQFTDHPHSRQNHDVNRRMRIKPEEMLKQNRIAAEFWIKDS